MLNQNPRHLDITVARSNLKKRESTTDRHLHARTVVERLVSGRDVSGIDSLQ